jgi:site-specific DNA recombinase
MKEKCALYVRVSTALGNQDYTRQISDLTDIALKDGYLLENIVVYSDMISGYKFEDREKLNQLLDEVRLDPKLYERIYITEISRLGRGPKNTRQIIEELIDLKIPIFIQSLNQLTLESNGQRNSYISVILQVLLEMADMEANTFKIRSKSGRIQKVKEGKAGGGKYYPYGYKKDENKLLVVDDEESAVIVKIFNLYIEGFGIRAISHILNSENIPTRSNKSFPNQDFNYKTPKKGKNVIWSEKQIHDILQNPIYKGKRRYLGLLYNAPSIIAEDLFDECNILLKNKNNRNSNTEYTYLLKNLLTCGVCGRNYTGRYKPEPKGEKVYKCASTLYKGGSCSNFGINIELIESIIFNEILNSDYSLKLISNKDNLLKEIKNRMKILGSKKINCEKNLNTNIKRLDNLLTLYIDRDITTEEYRSKKEQFDSNKMDLEIEIATLNKKISENQQTLNELNDPNNTKLELLKSTTNRIQLKNIFKQLISKVVVNYLSKDYILVTIYLKIGTEVLKVPMKTLIDLSQFRKKTKVIKYKSLYRMSNEPKFNNGILNNKDLEIISEFNSEILYDWIILTRNQFICMGNSIISD